MGETILEYNVTLRVVTECAIQCVPEKRKPMNQVNLSENCHYDLSEKVYIVNKIQFILFLLTPLMNMYWSRMTKHEPFEMVMSKLICAEWEFKGL